MTTSDRFRPRARHGFGNVLGVVRELRRREPVLEGPRRHADEQSCDRDGDDELDQREARVTGSPSFPRTREPRFFPKALGPRVHGDDESFADVVTE